MASSLPAMGWSTRSVVHIATAIPRDTTLPKAWDANTRLRTTVVKTLLKASLEVGVRCYVQQSITMAYPDYGEDWITEDTPLDISPDQVLISAPVITMEEMIRNVSPDELHWCIKLRNLSWSGYPYTILFLTS